MIYEYRCLACDKDFDVIKRHTEIDRKESCQDCGKELQRQISKSSVNKPFNGHYSPAFGKMVNSRQDIRDEMLKHRDRTGTELVELGNDRIKKRERATEIPKEAYEEMQRALKR